MTTGKAKVVATIANLALLGLTVFTMTKGVELEGSDVVLFLLMLLAPVVSLAALCWPSLPASVVPAPPRAMEGQE